MKTIEIGTGGFSCILSPGDNLDDVADSHVALLTDELRDASSDPLNHLQSISGPGSITACNFA